MEEQRQKSTLLIGKVNDISAIGTSECEGAKSQGPRDKWGLGKEVPCGMLIRFNLYSQKMGIH